MTKIRNLLRAADSDALQRRRQLQGKAQRRERRDELLAEFRSIKEGVPTTTTVITPELPDFLAVDAEGVEEELPVFVARDKELGKMKGFLDLVLSGKGQIVFVEG